MDQNLNNMSIFTDAIFSKPKRSAFPLSHEYRFTTRFGSLVPCLTEEILPSDKWKFSTESFTRFAPMQAPIMQRINTFQHYWFVPNRIIWKDWEEFISPRGVRGETKPVKPHIYFDGADSAISDSTSQAILKSALGGKKGSLFEYMGINLCHLSSASFSDFCSIGEKIDLLPFLAYWRIMYEFYADENQVNVREEIEKLNLISQLGEIKLSTIASLRLTSDSSSPFYSVYFSDWLVNHANPWQRAWEKDYFTSALPTTQRGEEVTLGGVQRIDNAYVNIDGAKVTSKRVTADVGGTIAEGTPVVLSSAKNAAGDNLYVSTVDGTNAMEGTMHGEVSDDTMYQVTDVDGQPVEINPVTINELRRAVKLQEFLEKSMRGGYRLIEQIKAHFGVTSSNGLLDLPQWLGGDFQKAIISEWSSASATEDAVLGEYSGHATEVGNTKRRTFFSEEHGWLFCIYSCIPRSSYSQGIRRQFQRFDWLDYAWPEFSHLGEQPVLNKELYVGTDGKNDETFGYQSRYADYKTIPSSVHGSFRDDMAYWTMSRRFSSRPTLSNNFVTVRSNDSSITDVFTVVQSDSDYLTVDLYHKITAIRPLPKFGTPML